ncbi:hypothetical protein ABT008_19895 [Micromonospora sp. NPDC002389]|uniref:hypothetical protein n=1 Tax=Micromonospora sp. NPDC002389 TaxID=3154272 RepID=UPI003334092D
MSETVGRIEKDLGIEPGLSSHAIEVLATVENGIEDLAQHLRYLGQKDRETLTAMIGEISVCESARTSSTYHEQFVALASILPATKKRSASEVLLSDVRDRLKNLPGDVFFLSSLDQDHTEGYVAYLRLIRETQLHQLSTSYYDKDARGIVANRTSSLRAPYVYRLTQQMADVFASIGLPVEYELARDSILDSRLAPEPMLERT